jgi:hypothetical protein
MQAGDKQVSDIAYFIILVGMNLALYIRLDGKFSLQQKIITAIIDRFSTRADSLMSKGSTDNCKVTLH